MSLIHINRYDITVGEPLPWPLFDQKHNMVIDQGSVVRDHEHRDKLLASGVYRELSWGLFGDEDSDNSLLTDEETPDEQPKTDDKTDEKGAKFTFNDMKLKAEDRLQLQPPTQLANERFLVKVIGFLRGVSLLVTAPVTANGLRLQIREGEKVVMRSFSGQNAFGFACKIERVCIIPYEYLHLSFPDVIEGLVIRKAPRVKTRIIATVQNTNPANTEGQVSAIISNISANGLALDAKRELGSKGDILNLTFRVHLHHIDAFLSLKGLICAVLRGDSDNAPANDLIRHGVEFQELQPNDSVILQSMIYQQMIENPDKLM